MKLKAVFCVVCAALVLCAADQPSAFADIDDKPQGRARDFATNLYLEGKNGSAAEARTLFYSLRTVKPAALNALNSRLNSPSLSKFLQCRNMAAKAYLSADAACLAVGFNIAKTESLTPKERGALAAKIAEIDPQKAAILRSMAAKEPLKNAEQNREIFLQIALGASIEFLRRNDAEINVSGVQNDMRFSQLIERAAVNKLPPKLTRSLLNSDPKLLDFKGAFYLGILQLIGDQRENALAAFRAAEKSAVIREQKDRAVFWQYLISNSDQLLETLKTSPDINFYSLYACEKLNAPLPKILLEAKAGKRSKTAYTENEFSDPFFWHGLQQKIANNDTKALNEELAKLTLPAHEPFRAAIITALNPTSAPIFFLNPYPQLLTELNADYTAQTLAIMRQESRYIPSALSSSYAIGAMQMMPFLLDALAPKIKAQLWSYFDIANEMPLAQKHLKWLNSKFDHPLFIFYAYNGGHGFTKRMLEGKNMFNNGEFEPFMSLERVYLEEPREYGKKVLTNYVIYRAILDDKITMTELLRTLTPQTD